MQKQKQTKRTDNPEQDTKKGTKEENEIISVLTKQVLYFHLISKYGSHLMPLPLTPLAPLVGASQPQGGAETASPATLTYQLLERTESSLPKGMASDQTQTAGHWSECSECECSGYFNNINPIVLPLPQKRS